MKRLFVGFLVSTMLLGCGNSSCCDDAEVLAYHDNNGTITLKNGIDPDTIKVGVERIYVELYCQCDGSIYSDIGYIERTTHLNGAVSVRTVFTKRIDDLLGRHPDLNPTFRRSGTFGEFVDIMRVS